MSTETINTIDNVFIETQKLLHTFKLGIKFIKLRAAVTSFSSKLNHLQVILNSQHNSTRPDFGFTNTVIKATS